MKENGYGNYGESTTWATAGNYQTYVQTRWTDGTADHSEYLAGSAYYDADGAYHVDLSSDVHGVDGSEDGNFNNVFTVPLRLAQTVWTLLVGSLLIRRRR